MLWGAEQRSAYGKFLPIRLAEALRLLFRAFAPVALLVTKVITLRKSIQRFEDEENDIQAGVAREDMAGWKSVLDQVTGMVTALPGAEREQVEEAARIVRAHRSNLRAGNLPMGSVWKESI